jgi:hypothetical protein
LLFMAALAGPALLCGCAGSITTSSVAGLAQATATTSTSASPPSSTSTAPSSTSSTSSSTSSTSTTSAAERIIPGDILIADRGNNRLLLVSPDKRILWEMTLPGPATKNGLLLGPDDTFFSPDYKQATFSEEDNQVAGVIDLAAEKILWQYGRAGVKGSAKGLFNTPDDAVLLADGTMTVCDIDNQRILFLDRSGSIVRQYGTTGVAGHDPPRVLGAPNGDIPTSDGGMLITEIDGSYVDKVDRSGRLVYSVQLKDIGYPSDAYPTADGNILVCDYARPGRLEIVTPKGLVLWDYRVTSGSGELDHPSLARPLPNGIILATDDRNHRVVAIDPTTKKIVWEYGTKGVPGTGAGELSTPDGLDFLPAGAAMP